MRHITDCMENEDCWLCEKGEPHTHGPVTMVAGRVVHVPGESAYGAELPDPERSTRPRDGRGA